MSYFIDPIKKHFADFKGRATRKQFWLFTLFDFIVWCLLGFVFSFFGQIGNILYFVCVVALLIPFMSIGCRRLRDAGFSPWWILLGVLPLVLAFLFGWLLGIGSLVLLIMCLFPSK